MLLCQIHFHTIKSLPQISGIENEQAGVKRNKKYAFWISYSVYLILELDNMLHDYKIKQNENENKGIFELKAIENNEH